MEIVAGALEQQQQIVGDVAARNVDAHDGVRDRKALVDGHRVRHPVAHVHHHSRGPSRRVPAHVSN